MINDRTTGKSRGYGFVRQNRKAMKSLPWMFQVTMARREAAEEAVQDPNPVIDGRRANVNLAYLGAKNRNPTMQMGYGLLARMPPTYPSAYPSSNLMYYQLAATQQAPIYLTPSTTGTTSWPTTTNTTLYELPGAAALFDTSAASLTNTTSANTAGAQIYWSSYN